ncbi:MAG TPA: hypothetical protein VFJ85_01555 [Acidimicrobiales bacterium]|nr:hypothetical protein [Acidimicrobiales bacterium]
MAETAEARRFRTALAMADLGVALMRQNLRRRHPGASEVEIDARLRRWLADRPPDAPGRPRAITSW